MATLQERMIKQFPVKENFKVLDAPPGGLDNLGKWKISLIAGLIFLIVSSPFLYKLVQKLADKFVDIEIADSEGCPTLVGLILHSVVFVIIVRLMMK
jgi:hypothetical protein